MSDLSTNICFDALSVLNNNVQLVEDVCSICGSSHYTQNCPEFGKGDHIKDKPSLNLSRSSVPNGLLIMDAADGSSCVVTSQKFAKGTRFGPLLAQKSYTPIKNIPFPLVLFATPFYYGNEFDFDLQTLFNGRNVYLDTRNESKCNWMIHVSLARFSNEQNLICYQENDEIYYTATKDIELGDILRVWYSRNYAAKLGAALLEPSPYDICNNILRSVSLDYGLDLDHNQNYVDSFASTSGSSQVSLLPGVSDVNNNSNSSSQAAASSGADSYDKISLPPIDSLMKTTSPKYTTNPYMFDLDLIGTTLRQPCDGYSPYNPPSQMHHSSQHQSPSHSQMHSHIGDIHQMPLQHMTHQTYAGFQTLPEDTLSPADLINISLGASDMNISFDSFGAGNIMGYEGTSNSGSNLGDSGISVGVGIEKLHSRYSSSTDSLATLNDNLIMVPTSSATPAAGTSGADPEADKKYPCEICLRKYMTKSNLDKHMRKHNLFLCVFCMKLFQLAEELKDHECTERKSKTTYLHCPKCLKVLSNSWSLQRHMKIHKDPNESVLSGAEESADKLLLEPKEEPVFDEIDTTALDELKPSIDSLEATGPESMLLSDETSDVVLAEPDPILVQEMEVEQEHEPIPPPPVVTIPTITSIPITNTSSSQDMITDVQAANGKQIYKCIVCAKLFKNPNALEKHLRKVHTVYTVSNDYKSEKKVLTQINQKKTSPIKPAIAKALATKLTQKNKKMEANAAANATANATSSSVAAVVPEQPVHVPRQYNKKKHQNKMVTSSSSSSAVVPHTSGIATACTPVASVSPGPTASTSNKSHSIIIISNLELTNNNLIDTSQLFLNQNSNALGNKIDVKVLNSTDKLPKLVPISNHGVHQHHHQPATLLPTAILPTAAAGGTAQVSPTNQFQSTAISSAMIADGNGPLLNGFVTNSQNANIEYVNVTSRILSDSTRSEVCGSPLLPLSPFELGGGSQNGDHQQAYSTSDTMNNSFLSPDELSVDANDSNPYEGDSDSAQLTTASYPCDECDKVFPKNYQLKRHMEIHDSTYYMCPYCDRSPLKAKTSVRKHLNTVHPERAPPKEEMNKFISTLVVKDEKILRELYAKNERKIRNKCAKMLAKHQQKEQQQQQKQQQQQTVVGSSLNHMSAEVTRVAPEEMLNTYHSDADSMENGSSAERTSVNVGAEGAHEDGAVLKRKTHDTGANHLSRGGSSGEECKKLKIVDGNGQEVRYAGGNGALKYLRKKSTGAAGGEGSSSSSMHPPGGHNPSIDNQMMLDNLFDNISIENYEFDDNTSIQSYSMIEERFKTSFDQIQEKLDAELSFGEEQLKWQNNLMANDSSNEIGDKLLNVEENIMLI